MWKVCWREASIQQSETFTSAEEAKAKKRVVDSCEFHGAAGDVTRPRPGSRQVTIADERAHEEIDSAAANYMEEIFLEAFMKMDPSLAGKIIRFP